MKKYHQENNEKTTQSQVDADNRKAQESADAWDKISAVWDKCGGKE